MITADVILAPGVSIPRPDLVNLYGCQIGTRTKIGAFVEIQRGVIIGADCKISSHSFLCTGVILEDQVFIGHGVMFTNDRYPQATTASGVLQTEQDWQVIPTLIQYRASIGSHATILAGIRVGTGALIGAGAVVTTDVADYQIVVGVPAKPIGYREYT